MKKTSTVSLVAIVVASLAVGAGAASAQGARGVITGRVMECAPGPVVASPPAPKPKPQAVTVTLYRNGAAFLTKRVALPARLPWDGTFTFSVPPARYEVISSYQHRVRWVNLAAGGHDVVTFTTGACPL
jgi:hypothetical protein